jgi:hypothetical protein
MKLKTARQVFRKLKADLGVNIEGPGGEERRLTIFEPGELKRTKIGDISNQMREPLQNLHKVWNAKFTKSNLFKSCLICGSVDNVEMHHVKKIRNLRDKTSKADFFTRQMEAMNRKQIPLCRDHHQRLHKREWTTEEREILRVKASGEKRAAEKKEKEEKRGGEIIKNRKYKEGDIR